MAVSMGLPVQLELKASMVPQVRSVLKVSSVRLASMACSGWQERTEQRESAGRLQTNCPRRRTKSFLSPAGSPWIKHQQLLMPVIGICTT